MDQRELQKKLNQPYTPENWKEIIRYVFPNVSIFATPKIIPVQEKDKVYVDTLLHLGTVKLKDGKVLDLLELKLKENVNLLKNRVKLNDIVTSTVDMDRSHGVLSVFEKGTEDYRFTFSAKASAFNEEEGDFVVHRTDTRRFTYLLGKNESCKTPAERFQTLSAKKNDADISTIEDAFSVEKLSKKFFDDYKEQYEAFVAYLTNTPGLYTAVFSTDEKKIRDFVKIFLGRIVFIKYVQKKGWMGVPAEEKGWDNGDYRFLENAFKNFKHKDNFYSEFLKPLFFEALNKGDRTNNIFELTETKVPYLSGGLFDNHDPKTRTINFPKEYFESLFEFLDRYNFTIDENDVNDQEVGIDPEMLGHIFENLLEDNKDKGAFYTPKEIVRYMCRESLKEYLKTSLQNQNIWPKNEDKARTLKAGLDDFVNKREAGGIIDFEGSIAQALKTVKICDPAIGSGAFPMGLLQEIFHLMHLLYDASPDKVGEIWELDTWKPNVVKQNIIQNSIYGVDIEKGAVDIARLRFWLSLIVDEPEPTALPHLDYKIVVGNSLLSKFDDTIIDINWELENPKAGFFGSKLAEERATILEKISEKQKQAFDPESNDDKLSKEIRDLKIDLLVKQLEVMAEKQNIQSEPKAANYKNKSKSKFVEDKKKYFETLEWKQQIQELKNLKSNQEAPFNYFEWKLDFPEVMNENLSKKIGFDIVIGNPPYVRHEKLNPADKENFKNKYLRVGKTTADIYVYFFDLATQLLKKNGTLIFITQNKYLKAQYGDKLRKVFKEKYHIDSIIDFFELPVFNGVATDAAITKMINHPPKQITSYFPIETFNKKHPIQLKRELLTIKEDSGWQFVQKEAFSILEKLKYNSITLKEFTGGKMFYGVKTGYNSAFIIDEGTKDEIISGDPNSFDLLSKYVIPKDIKAFNTDWKGKWMITTFPAKEVDIENYPGIKKYLEQFLPKLKQTGESYISSTGEKVKTRKKTSGKWFETQDSISYYPLFNSDKIIYIHTAKNHSFHYDSEGYVVNNSCYFISTTSKYLALYLNSNLFDWFKKINFVAYGDGETSGRVKLDQNKMIDVPIRPIDDELNKKMENLFFQLESSSPDCRKEIMNTVNLTIYMIYGLSYSEILFFDKKFKTQFSLTDYEKFCARGKSMNSQLKKKITWKN